MNGIARAAAITAEENPLTVLPASQHIMSQPGNSRPVGSGENVLQPTGVIGKKIFRGYSFFHKCGLFGQNGLLHPLEVVETILVIEEACAILLYDFPYGIFNRFLWLIACGKQLV